MPARLTAVASEAAPLPRLRQQGPERITFTVARVCSSAALFSSGRVLTITGRATTTRRLWWPRPPLTGTTARRSLPTIPTCQIAPAAGSSWSRTPTDMATKPETTNDIKVDQNALFLEEIFNDRRVGT